MISVFFLVGGGPEDLKKSTSVSGFSCVFSSAVLLNLLFHTVNVIFKIGHARNACLCLSVPHDIFPSEVKTQEAEF